VYTHIIVPFDGEEPSRRAAGVGADLARLFDNRLVVVTATPSDGGADVQALKERAQQMSDERVDVWIEPNNKPVDAIATTVKFRPQSIICMSTHARQGLRRAVYGSIAESIISRVDVPVVLLGPNYPGEQTLDVRQIVVAVDNSATSQSVLPLAAQWSQFLDLPCTLLHITNHAEEVGRHKGPDLEMLASLLEKRSPRVEVVRHPHRDVAAGILDVITPSSRSLAIMATHGRGGVGRQSSTSHVMKVVERARVPVLVERAGVKRMAAQPARPASA
jgi:nucleotide-binding universal stress UspA family protein